MDKLDFLAGILTVVAWSQLARRATTPTLQILVVVGVVGLLLSPLMFEPLFMIGVSALAALTFWILSKRVSRKPAIASEELRIQTGSESIKG